MKIEVKNLAGEVVDKLELKSGVFDVDVNEELLHQVYVAQYANKRHSKAHTKTRGEVRGSTKKPWKQKGTGRARTGDVKNPIWRSGGTVFGPRNNRNYSQKINKKVARLATVMAIVSKIKEGKLTVVDNYKLDEVKTRLMDNALNSLSIKGKTLIVFGEKAEKYSRASRNLTGVQNISLNQLNVFDMLNNKNLIICKEGLLAIEKKYSK